MRDEPQSSKLFEDGEAQRLADSMELLVDMGREFAASLDIEATLKTALARIIDYVEAEGGALFVLEDDGTLLTCHVCAGATDITGMTIKSDQGIVGRCVQSGRGDIVRDVAQDPSFDGSVDAKTGFTTKSILCAPLGAGDERIGAIELINRRGGDGLFSNNDLILLQTLSASAALAIQNARMAADRVEQEKIRRELELAAEIQRNLLPSDPGPNSPIYGINIPARTVSGDFYDFFTLEDGRIAFCLGDVSGKGINAAMLMAKTASLYRCLGKTETRPGKLLARLNEEISETATRGMFVTIVGGIYNPENMTVRVANAGHEPPLLRKSDGRYERFEAEAPPVGISADAVGENGYPEFEISLAGGALYLFTDGVTEGKRGDGSMLGADGVEAILEDTAALDLRSRLERIVDVFDTKDLHDDITIVGIDSSAPDQITAASPDEGAATVPLLEYNFPARAGRLRDARHAMRRFLEDAGYDGTLVPDVVLAVDEACQNIIRHAYGGDSDLEIQLAVSLEPRRLIIELTDSADPVNTEEVRPRQLDNVRPGGLGVHFMHEIMDEVAYVSVPGNSGNVLRMVKNSAEDVEAVEAKEDMKE